MSIQYKSIKNLTSMLQNKEISHKELINETFTLIESKMDLNAFITLNKDAAIEKATLLDSKKNDSSLTGIPIAQKDLFCTKDLRTTCGSNMLSSFKCRPSSSWGHQNINF
ncbi:amidase family protein [Gammaproteobacteria bacterium]|nr:amidase family protein [Gammaproteobacteria bacterium]